MMLQFSALLTGFLGFIALAMATERQAQALLARLPKPGVRWALRATGWLLLAAALAIAFRAWGWSIGAVGWIGGLGVAGVALVFTLPWWPAASRPVRTSPVHRREPTSSVLDTAVAIPERRRSLAWWMGACMLVAIPVVFAIQLLSVPVKPTLHADAIDGKAGQLRRHAKP